MNERATDGSWWNASPADAPIRSFALVSPERYQHPTDVQSMNMLRNSAGLEDLIRIFSEHFHERAAQLQNVVHHVRVGPRQLAGVYEIHRGCCQRLGVVPEPELYIGHGNNAWTAGIEEPHIVLGADLLGLLSPRDLMYVIGHELGHIRCEHVLYQSLSNWVSNLTSRVPVVGRQLANSLQAMLLSYSRSTELSADRAGLLACDDLESVSRTLLKLTEYPLWLVQQLDLAACVEQANELHRMSDDVVSRMMRENAEGPLDHPWIVLRISELHQWTKSDEYAQLLNAAESVHSIASPPLILSAPADYKCPVCSEIVPGEDRFCSSCGAPVREQDRLPKQAERSET